MKVTKAVFFFACACVSSVHAADVQYTPITVPSWDCYPFSPGGFNWYQSWDTLNSGVVFWGGPNYSGSSDSSSLYYSNGNTGYYYQILDTTVQGTDQAFKLTWYTASLQNIDLRQEVVLFYTSKDSSFNGTTGTGIDSDIANNQLLFLNGPISQLNPLDASDANGWSSYTLEGLVDGASVQGAHLGIAIRAIFPDGTAEAVYFDSFGLNSGILVPETSYYATLMGFVGALAPIIRRRRK